MTSFELKKCITDLAFTTQSEAAFVSCYIPFKPALTQHLSDARPSEGADRAAEAFDKIVNFVPLCSYAPVKSLAAFARVGVSPYFLALPLPVPVAPHVAVGPLPEIYPLIEIAGRHEPFVIGVCQPCELRIFFVDLGTVVREARIGGTLERRAAVLELAVRSWQSEWMILAGEPREIACMCDASSESVLRKLAGTVPGPIQRAEEAVHAAAAVVDRRRQQISRERVQQLSRDWAPSGCTVAGPVTTLRALGAGVAKTIWLAADCPPATCRHLRRLRRRGMEAGQSVLMPEMRGCLSLRNRQPGRNRTSGYPSEGLDRNALGGWSPCSIRGRRLHGTAPPVQPALRR